MPRHSERTAEILRTFQEVQTRYQLILLCGGFNRRFFKSKTEKAIVSALETLDASIEKLVAKDPFGAQIALMRQPKMPIASTQRWLAHLHDPEFLLQYGRRMAYHNPKLLLEFADRFKDLPKEDRMRIGVCLGTEDQIDWALHFKDMNADQLIFASQEYDLSASKWEPILDNGLCYAFTLSLIAQGAPDPGQTDWSKVRFVQNLYSHACVTKFDPQGEMLQKEIQKVCRWNDSFVERYPLIAKHIGKRLTNPSF